VVTRKTLINLRSHTILEIGCGTGKNTGLLAQIGERVIAIDLSEGMIQRARAKIRSTNVSFVIADITAPWPCKDQSAGLIVCNLVLEHVHDLSFIFSEAFRVLKSGGKLFISELHPFRQYHGTKANFQRDGETIEVEAFVHHLSDFTEPAARCGLSICSFNEWWHREDEHELPRLVSFVFKKREKLD
jgi:malonyl-CoA O-methyltransferase